MRRPRFAAVEETRKRAVDADSTIQLCAFRVGDEAYAIDLRRVEEILRPPRLARVPHAPSWVEGVINLRGAIVPVIDLRKWLRFTRSETAAKPKCIICRVGRDRVGILVDGATEVLRVRVSDLRPVPPAMAGAAPR